MIDGNSSISYTIGNYIVKTVGSALAILAPLKIYLGVTIAFILIDMWYGIRAALHGKTIHTVQDFFDVIDIEKLLKTASKLGDYALLMSGTFLFDQFVLKNESYYLTSIFTGIVCGAQFISVLKNLSKIKPEGPWGLFKVFLTKKASQTLDMSEETINENLKAVETNVSKSNKKVRKHR